MAFALLTPGMLRPWLRAFNDEIAGSIYGTAARALLPYAEPSELQSAESAVMAVSRWEQAWLVDHQDLDRLTARSYASRLRIALRDFDANCEGE